MNYEAMYLQNIENLLFNIGKHIYGRQSKLTRWKNSFKKKGRVVRKEEGLIELELTKESSSDNELEGVEINLKEYPFIYYRNIKDSVFDKKGLEVISIIKDIDTLRELIMKDLTTKEEISLEDVVVLYMVKPLEIRIASKSEEGYTDYHTVSSWNCFDVNKETKGVNHTIEFDLYEIEIDGKKTDYIKSTTSAESIINSRVDKTKQVRVFKNGKEVKQGVRCFDATTKEKWLYKGEELDTNRKIYKDIKLLEK